MEQLKTWFADTALRLGWAPPWLVSTLLIILAVTVAVSVHALVVQLVRRAISRHSAFWQPLIARTRRPTRLAFIVAAKQSRLQARQTDVEDPAVAATEGQPS